MKFVGKKSPSGFTLVELLVVLVILAVLAGMVIPLLGESAEQGRLAVTQANLQRMREVIVGAPQAPGYLADTGKLPRTIKDLFIVPADNLAYLPQNLQTWNPVAKRGWRGPYLLDPGTRFDFDLDMIPDPAIFDGWGNPILLQIPTASMTAAENERHLRLVSAGPNGILDTPQAPLMPTVASRVDDLVLFLQVSDVQP